MKKLALTIAVVLGMSIGAFAQGGLFQYGNTNQAFSSPTWFGTTTSWQTNWNRDGGNPLLPGHGSDENQAAAPLGSGALLLIGFGAAYALKKRNQK